MGRFPASLLLALAVVLTTASLALTTPSNQGELNKDELHRLSLLNTSRGGGRNAGSAFNMEVVGHHDIGGRGFNADVWVHADHAYVGHWGFTDWSQGSKNRFCPEFPNNGVAVIDVSDPANPLDVARLQNPAGTSAEDVVVFTAEHGPMAGHDIAAVGIQVCGGSRTDPSFPRGLQLFDVTDPSAPVELSFLSTGCCTRGLHEFEVEHRADLGRTFAYATVPASEYPDAGSPTGRRDHLGRGDFRLIDITDPTAPFEVSDWGVIKDLGGPPAEGQGCDPDPIFGHGAEPSGDGTEVFLAYWDSGYIALDLTDPTAPVLQGRTVYPANTDGDAHSSNFDDARQLLFTADEDFCKNSGPGIEKGWGYLRVFDYSNRSAPVQIGEFRTQNSQIVGGTIAGDYTIHNPLVVGTDVYISWYSDGIRVVDASDPTAMVEVAHFVPPSTQNPVRPPQRGVLSQAAQVWGVAVDEAGLVYASDMNSGLWILRRTDLG